MLTLRSGGFAVLAIAAIAIFFTMAPQEPETTFSGETYRSLIDVALSDYEANDDLAESAPQQQVVNGWVARDLLRVMAMASADQLDATVVATSEPDERVPALLVVVILAMLWWAMTEAGAKTPQVVTPASPG